MANIATFEHNYSGGFVATLKLVLSILMSPLASFRAIYQKIQESRLERDRTAEVERISALPRINTEHLLKIPGDNQGCARTYGFRNGQLVIFDEFGQKFVGLKTAAIMNDLIAAEFTPEDHWVPFCGPGEMHAGQAVKMGGFTMKNYPLILSDKDVDSAMWSQWLKIVQNQAIDKFLDQPVNYPVNWSGEIRAIMKNRQRLGVLIPVA